MQRNFSFLGCCGAVPHFDFCCTIGIRCAILCISGYLSCNRTFPFGGAVVRCAILVFIVNLKWSDPSVDPAQEGATCIRLPFYC
jgi:hypothetical protein